ncbi:MAG: ankyrin repeat domain-containing protein [Verrucomicrobiota bacterium]|nr:ankyrin repeat domain-containing protein [Verrucomicrobiota bacterium]
MHITTNGALLKGTLAGVILLQAYSFAPEPLGKTQLPPETFARAVENKNALLVEHCFAEGVNVNALGADGRSPLLVATEQRDRELINRLLQAGADVALADASGTTPMMLAAEQGDLDLLRTFLGRSAKPEAVDAEGGTALQRAIAAGKFEAAELLVQSTTTLPAATPDGRDFVAVACDTGSALLTKAVLARAHNALDWTPSSRHALTVALASRDAELTKLLLAKHAAPPSVEGRAIPLLAHAIVSDDRALFDALLAAGTDANVLVPAGADKEFLTLLGSSYIRDYVKADDGITPLMLAAGFAKPEYVRALLDAGAHKNNMTTRYKMMALYFAARTNKWKSVQMLLGSGTTPEKLRIEISLASQRAAIIKDGEAIFQTACSTGRAGYSTPAGQFVITDKERSHKSTIYHVEMPFFMRLNCRDFGLHAGVVPNYPASHGCIRLPSEVAQKLFSEIPVGTVVMIN